MKRLALIPSLILPLIACGPSQPCPTCDDDGDDPPADMAEELPDLPCDGADLQNDDRNCGACGNECWPRLEGTKYEAGGCEAGVCGPRWFGDEWPEPSPLTCADICAAVTLTCRANGCSGLTGFVCETTFGQACDTKIEGNPALLDFSGACDEPIPWPEPILGWDRQVYCCCG